MGSVHQISDTSNASWKKISEGVSNKGVADVHEGGSFPDLE